MLQVKEARMRERERERERGEKHITEKTGGRIQGYDSRDKPL